MDENKSRVQQLDNEDNLGIRLLTNAIYDMRDRLEDEREKTEKYRDEQKTQISEIFYALKGDGVNPGLIKKVANIEEYQKTTDEKIDKISRRQRFVQRIFKSIFVGIGIGAKSAWEWFQTKHLK